jgi:hypothetical protein
MDSILGWIAGKKPDKDKSAHGAKVARVKVKFGILCMQRDGSVAFQIRTRDICEYNVGFTSKIPLVLGERLKLLIQSPLDYTTITIQGKICYLDSGKKGYSGIIEFTEMSESDRNKLKKAIQKYKT